MPPRTRKTTPKPADPAAPDASGPEEPQLPAADDGKPGTTSPDGQDQTPTATPDDKPQDTPPADVDADAEAEAATGDRDAAAQASATADPGAQDPEPAAPEALEATAEAFHWETPAGDRDDPCRLCMPHGVQLSAGSVGCQHGQWVRVRDDDQ
ncbi:hypothetical protein [Actinacidiphila acididurans]|uniref:Uncharacterized protein n=1 Tax=Actinacidiphila acididurans TaxID=2784346 RepID=A0ABS2U313_9ACTN|nr:hypothetical protein [Actinacidiphila acididurans]MBM9509989.1 hypothetical protein [Actinacidiphila acididurans]